MLCRSLFWLYIFCFPISIRLTSLALWQSNDCPSASKATLRNMDKYFMWIHYERLYNHNKAKHNKTVCIFIGIYCIPKSVLVYNLALQRLSWTGFPVFSFDTLQHTNIYWEEVVTRVTSLIYTNRYSLLRIVRQINGRWQTIQQTNSSVLLYSM